MGKAGEGDFGKGLGDGLAEVVGGGFAFDVGAGGEDDFADLADAEALEEGGDAEVVGADVVEGAEAAVEGVVAAAEGTAALEGEDVGGLFDDAEEGVVAGGVVAKGAAEAAAGEEATGGAEEDVGAGGVEGLGEVGGGGVGGAE